MSLALQKQMWVKPGSAPNPARWGGPRPLWEGGAAKAGAAARPGPVGRTPPGFQQAPVMLLLVVEAWHGCQEESGGLSAFQETVSADGG